MPNEVIYAKLKYMNQLIDAVLHPHNGCTSKAQPTAPHQLSPLYSFLNLEEILVRLTCCFIYTVAPPYSRCWRVGLSALPFISIIRVSIIKERFRTTVQRIDDAVCIMHPLDPTYALTGWTEGWLSLQRRDYYKDETMRDC